MSTKEELELKSDMCRNMGARIFFAERALRSIALNYAEAARSGVTEALNALNGILPNSAPSAEPSGNTGELPVCATCGGTGEVCDSCTATENCGRILADATTKPCPDCSAAQPCTNRGAEKVTERDPKVNPMRGDEVATGSERVLVEEADDVNLSYRVLKSTGQWSRLYLTTVAYWRKWTIMEILRRGEDVAAQPATEQPRIWRMRDSQGVLHLRVFSSERTARRWANVAGGAVVYSTDNGETWIDEQAEREGK